MKPVQLLLRLCCRTVVGRASVVDDGSDECLVDDNYYTFGRSPSRSCYRAHEDQSDCASVNDVVDVCCSCQAPVEDDAVELRCRCLLQLDHDVIDLQADICRDVFASREEDGDCLVDRDLEAPFSEEFCRLR